MTLVACICRWGSLVLPEFPTAPTTSPIRTRSPARFRTLVPNHLPIIGTIAGVLLLLTGVLRRTDELRRVSLSRCGLDLLERASQPLIGVLRHRLQSVTIDQFEHRRRTSD